ncbi:hypothetical protein GJ744_002293 [Endocarpon pusillum]|uniref:Uncharacterized protein n=1 Tax=Endocarpon pusillum TaxID=364733 RepID=A0A8H7AS09_9EURO|nr:hypothetical protein GJ744_002293 [Endocarpon pusillum]
MYDGVSNPVPALESDSKTRLLLLFRPTAPGDQSPWQAGEDNEMLLSSIRALIFTAVHGTFRCSAVSLLGIQKRSSVPVFRL